MPFRILVCAKQVPDTQKIKIDRKTGSLLRTGVPGVINGDDMHALEAALEIKDKYPGTKVSVLTMGPDQAEDLLFECIAMGADDGTMVSDKALAESDTLVTSMVLAEAVRKMGDFDLILCGCKASDGETGQVGPELAERLHIPQATFVCRLEPDPSGKRFIAKRHAPCGYEVVELKAPCLVSVVSEINTSRFMYMPAIFDYDMDIRKTDAKALDIDPGKAGLSGSPTKVVRSFAPAKKTGGTMIEMDDDRENAAVLLAKLAKAHVI